MSASMSHAIAQRTSNVLRRVVRCTRKAHRRAEFRGGTPRCAISSAEARRGDFEVAQKKAGKKKKKKDPVRPAAIAITAVAAFRFSGTSRPAAPRDPG